MFSIGADPEVFVCDDNGVRSIIGKIGGTKETPMPLVALGDGFAVQEDNVALEFNIPVSASRAAFIKNINSATGFLEKVVGDAYGFKFFKSSAIAFPEEELNDPRALEFGCDPDFNAWTRDANPRPTAADKTLRSCGGHVHIGFTGLDPYAVIKSMDLHVGVGSVLMDKGELRKQLYGKAGACRIKPYGAEYRTLSNFWIFDKRLIGWVYDNTARALDAVKAGMDIDSERDAILEAINGNNKDVAMELVRKHKLEIV